MIEVNSSIYIWGDLGSGYQQYPSEEMQDAFRTIAKESNPNTILAIHRDGDLMSYCYVRKLDGGEGKQPYLGMTFQVNSLVVNDLTELHLGFQSVFEWLIDSEKLIRLNKRGEEVPAISSLLGNEELLANIIHRLKNTLNITRDKIQKLPPIDYSIARQETITVSAEELETNIVETSIKYGYTFISSKDDFDSQQYRNIKESVKELSEEVEKYKCFYETEVQTNKKLRAQKKQVRLVNFLIILILIGSFVVYRIISSKNTTLLNSQSEVSQLQVVNEEQASKIDEYKESMTTLLQQNGRLKNDLALYKKHSPIIIESVYLEGDMDEDLGYTALLRLYSYNLSDITEKIDIYIYQVDGEHLNYITEDSLFLSSTLNNRESKGKMNHNIDESILYHFPVSNEEFKVMIYYKESLIYSESLFIE